MIVAQSGSGEYDGSINDGNAAVGVELVSGTLYLTGNNDYSGTTTIVGGILQAGSASALGDGGVTIENAGELDTYGQYLYVSSLNSTSTSAVITNSASGTAATLVFGYGGSSSFSGVIEDGGGTVGLAVGSSTVLSGVSTYSGTTEVYPDASLLAASTSALSPNSQVIVDESGLLDLSGFSNTIGSLSGYGTVQSSSGPATITVGADGTSATFAGTLQDGDSGSLALDKIGSGTLTLTGVNTYSGGTTVALGMLEAQTTAALAGFGVEGQMPVSVSAGATLAVAVGGAGDWNSSTSDDILTVLAGATFADGAIFGIDTTDGDFTYANIGDTIYGSLGLCKLGPNTLTLIGTNSFTAGATVEDGTLQLANGTSYLGNRGTDPGYGGTMDSNLTVDADGNFVFDDFTPLVYAGTISGSGNVYKTNTGEVTLTADSSGFTGTTNAESSTVDLQGPLGGTFTSSGGQFTGPYSPLQAFIVGLNTGAVGSSDAFVACTTDTGSQTPGDLSVTWHVTGPNGLSGTSSQTAFSFAPQSIGTYTITLYATDSDAASPLVSRTFVANGPPAVPGLDPGSSFTYTITGESGLQNPIYDWNATEVPADAAAPTFSANDTGAAYTTTASFSEAGQYTIAATVAIPDGQSKTVSFTVDPAQILSSVTLTAPSASIWVGDTSQQFTAAGFDQFGNPMSIPAGDIAWSAVTGTIGSTSGIYTPGPLGDDTITATVTNGVIVGSGSASVSIVPMPIAVSGDSTVNAGMPYMLNLASIDPAMTSLTIYWGDGNSQPLALLFRPPCRTSMVRPAFTQSRQPQTTGRSQRAS